MDQLVSSILDYSKIFRIKEMITAEYTECKRRSVDVVACGLAAFNEDAVKISRNFAT
jgi:2-methylcitrate dehydratase PrpD